MNRCTTRRVWHSAFRVVGMSAILFAGMVLIAAILTYGPALDAWSAKERERAVSSWGR